MTKLTIFFTSVLLLVGCGGATAPISTPTTTNDRSIPELVIEGPISHWIYNRVENIYKPKKMEFKPEYEEVYVSYKGKKTEAEMRLRGGIRFCNSFPHFKLKLPKSGKILGQREFK